MRESEESKMKPKPRMVEGASKRLDEILIEERDSIRLKIRRSNFEELSLKNTESLQGIILPIQ